MLRARKRSQVPSHNEFENYQSLNRWKQMALTKKQIGTYRSARALAALLLSAEKLAAWQVTGGLHTNSGPGSASPCISSHRQGPFLLPPPAVAPGHPVMKMVTYGAGPGQFDVVKFLRVAKRGLCASLEEENGKLNEDAMATLKLINKQNPAYPNPVEDNDLWSGSWRLMTALPCFGMRYLAPSSVVVEETEESSGNWTMESTVSFGTSEVKALLQLAGGASANIPNTFQNNLNQPPGGRDNKVLRLRIDSLTLTLGEGDKEKMAEIAPQVLECASDLGIALTQNDEAASWSGKVPLPLVRFAIEYLDQDFMAVELLNIGQQPSGNWLVFTMEGVDREKDF